MLTPEYENLEVAEQSGTKIPPPCFTPISADELLSSERELAEKRAALIAFYRQKIEECKTALVALGAKRVRKPRAEAKRRPGRPKGSRNRVTAETEATA